MFNKTFNTSIFIGISDPLSPLLHKRPIYELVILPCLSQYYRTMCTQWYSGLCEILDLQGVICKILQKPYICGRGGYNSWSDGAHHVDTLGPTKPQSHTIMF